MTNSIQIFLLALILHAAIYTVSSTCVDTCKAGKSSSAITCNEPCDLDDSVVSKLRKVYSNDVLATCLTPCRCGDDLVYSSDKNCESILSVLVVYGKECSCKIGNRAKRDATTKNPWEKWCRKQCSMGLGGSACRCDIIP